MITVTVYWCLYAVIAGNKQAIGFTHTNDGAELCQHARVLHILESFALSLRDARPVRRDGMGEMIHLDCKQMTVLHLEQYPGYIMS